MKIQVDGKVLKHLDLLCATGSTAAWGSQVQAWLMREELDRLRKQCAAKKHQKKATVKITAASAMCLSLLVSNIDSPHCLVVQVGVIEPLRKQLENHIPYERCQHR